LHSSCRAPRVIHLALGSGCAAVMPNMTQRVMPDDPSGLTSSSNTRQTLHSQMPVDTLGDGWVLSGSPRKCKSSGCKTQRSKVRAETRSTGSETATGPPRPTRPTLHARNPVCRRLPAMFGAGNMVHHEVEHGHHRYNVTAMHMFVHTTYTANRPPHAELLKNPSVPSEYPTISLNLAVSFFCCALRFRNPLISSSFAIRTSE